MKHILVIDDDSFFAKNITEMLDAQEFQVEAAENGEIGLEKVEKKMPDLILLDIMMPKMNGIEFLKIINDKYGKNKIPIIITSNLSTMEKISEGLSLGIKGYIAKSDETLESIADTVRNTFKKE
jgi:two-component system sensor histidine kinase/response regulator